MLNVVQCGGRAFKYAATIRQHDMLRVRNNVVISISCRRVLSKTQAVHLLSFQSSNFMGAVVLIVASSPIHPSVF